MKICQTLMHAVLLTSTALASTITSAMDFPLRAEDLNLNHRYTTNTHAGSDGPQKHGKDFNAVRHIGGDRWSYLTSDSADASKNSSYLIYGAAIRAMKAGTVVGCWRNAPQNKPGSVLDGVKDGTISGGGNYVLVEHDNGVLALYAHAQPGSVPSSICPHNDTYRTSSSDFNVTGGVRIAKGQYLGKVGNSGRSSGPHLHVHMEKSDGTPVKMKFNQSMTTSFASQKASINASWKTLEGEAIPNGEVMIWAPHSVGYWTVNNIADENMQAWFDHFVDSGEMPNTYACSDNGQIYNTSWVPSKGSWKAFHGMTLNTFQNKSANLAEKGYTRYGWWYCGSIYTGIWRK